MQMHYDPAGLILFLHTFFVRAGGLSELNQVDYKVFLNQEIGEKNEKNVHIYSKNEESNE